MTSVWESKKSPEEDSSHCKEQDLLEGLRQRLAAQEYEGRKELSFLRCLRCGEELEEIRFRGIMVERCAKCHGMWIDGDELERLTARARQGWLSHFWRSMGLKPNNSLGDMHFHDRLIKGEPV